MANGTNKLARDVLTLTSAGNSRGLRSLAAKQADSKVRSMMERTAGNLEKMTKEGAKTGKAPEILKTTMQIAEAYDDLNIKMEAANLNLAKNREELGQTLVKLIKFQLANVDLGVTVKEITDKYNTLSTTLATRVRKGFDQQSTALVEQTILWDRMGISIDTSTNLINKFDTVMGMSRKEISRTGRVMLDFAARTGQSAAKVFKDLADGAGQFYDILDSEQATRQTLIFQARARAMGTSISDLMGTMKKFEDIETAQTTGAQLNATLTALGGSFDSVKASAMDYPERMEYIAKSIQQVAPRIRKSSPRVQRAYMQALGKSGIDVGMIRRLIRFRPEEMAEGERALTGGMVGAITEGQERMFARRMTSIGQMAAPWQAEGLNLGGRAGQSLAVLAAGGMPGAITSVQKGKIAAGEGLQGIVNVLQKGITDAAPEIKEKIAEEFATGVLSGFTAEFDKFSGEIAAAFKKIRRLNREFSNDLRDHQTAKAHG